jgi:hypothetical protein
MMPFPREAAFMSRLRTYLWLIFFVSLPVSMFAWGPIGHMTVGYVAYQNLNPSAKARVRDLLKLNPEYPNWERAVPAGTSPDDHDLMVFMIATIWADDIKGDSRYSDDGPDPNTPDGTSSSQNIGYTDLFRHRYWHFVDKPFPTNLPIPTPNAETQIVAFRAVLASTQPDNLKSYGLVWLLHMIGDVHQPLHAATRVTGSKRDAGGNTVKLFGAASSNLHSYWDDLPGFDSSFCKDKIRCLNRAMVLGKSLKPAPLKAGHNINTPTWIQESFEYARAEVYKPPIGPGAGPFSIVPYSLYDVRAFRLAEKRVALAGARLAQILNTEMK